MKNPTNPDYDDIDALLREVDDLVKEPVPSVPGYDPRVGEYVPEEDPDATRRFDPAQPVPDSSDGFGAASDFPESFSADSTYPEDDCYDGGAFPDDREDGSVAYRNYSNNYGADLRNFSNGYGTGQAPVYEPEPEPTPVIPAYNADFQHKVREPRREREPRYADPEFPEPEPKKKKKHKKHHHRLGCLPVMLILIAVLVGGCVVAWNLFFRQPVSEVSIGPRKDDCSTILVCGLGWEQSLTDTMMLVHVNGAEKQIGLLSIPRDTRTITGQGDNGKLNAAYVRNGTGPEGMEGLLDYVQNLIGYRPDGYVLVNLSAVAKAADLMGTLEVDVPMTFDLEGVHVDAGLQTLSGEQVVQLLRFREGYVMADLQRVEVQRRVIAAALDQWLTVENLTKVGDILQMLFTSNGVDGGTANPENPFDAPPLILTNLTKYNFFWLGKTAMGNMLSSQPDKLIMNTAPGDSEMIGGVSYFEADLSAMAQLISASYNPYAVEIRPENLSLTGDVPQQ